MKIKDLVKSEVRKLKEAGNFHGPLNARHYRQPSPFGRYPKPVVGSSEWTPPAPDAPPVQAPQGPGAPELDEQPYSQRPGGHLWQLQGDPKELPSYRAGPGQAAAQHAQTAQQLQQAPNTPGAVSYPVQMNPATGATHMPGVPDNFGAGGQVPNQILGKAGTGTRVTKALPDPNFDWSKYLATRQDFPEPPQGQGYGPQTATTPQSIAALGGIAGRTSGFQSQPGDAPKTASNAYDPANDRGLSPNAQAATPQTPPPASTAPVNPYDPTGANRDAVTNIGRKKPVNAGFVPTISKLLKMESNPFDKKPVNAANWFNAQSFHQLPASAPPAQVFSCPSCGATGPDYKGSVDRHEGDRWVRRMGCCGALARDQY